MDETGTAWQTPKVYDAEQSAHHAPSANTYHGEVRVCTNRAARSIFRLGFTWTMEFFNFKLEDPIGTGVPVAKSY